MYLACPNCRAPVSFWRSIRTTAWGSYPCRFCGSILGVSFPHRLLALLPWAGLLGVFFGMFRWHNMGVHIYLPIMIGTGLICFYVCERVVLIERRAFTCMQCGYNLEGLTEPRCPECGTKFDPSERQRVLERMGGPPPRNRYVWAAILLFAVLLAGVIANFVVYSRMGVRPRTVPTARAPTAAPPVDSNASDPVGAEPEP